MSMKFPFYGSVEGVLNQRRFQLIAVSCFNETNLVEHRKDSFPVDHFSIRVLLITNMLSFRLYPTNGMNIRTKNTRAWFQHTLIDIVPRFSMRKRAVLSSNSLVSVVI